MGKFESKSRSLTQFVPTEFLAQTKDAQKTCLGMEGIGIKL